MAVLGHSKLEAVNHMLSAVGLLRVSALDTGGTSEEARAEYILDHWIRQVQAEGYADNMRHVVYSAGTDVTVGSDVLRIECVGPGRYAGNLALKEDKLYCVTEDSNVLATDVYCHEWVELTWDQASPVLKDRILTAATEDYMARVKQRPDLAAVLEKQTLMADRSAQRPDYRDEGVPPNQAPMGIQAQRAPGR